MMVPRDIGRRVLALGGIDKQIDCRKGIDAVLKAAERVCQRAKVSSDNLKRTVGGKKAFTAFFSRSTVPNFGCVPLASLFAFPSFGILQVARPHHLYYALCYRNNQVI